MAQGFGAFGKMPGLGDFFRVNLNGGFVEGWDAWLQSVILTARGALAGRWHECYMSAPIWRFTLSPGLAGESMMLGVLMASVDRVGRQFPLTLAAPVQGNAIAAHLSGTETFQTLEDIALDALDDAMTRDGLASRLAQTDLPPAMPATTAAMVLLNGRAQWMPDVASTLGALRRPSLWSAQVDGSLRMIAFDGLPDARAVTGLFDTDAALWHSGVSHV
jgi:type VI secretion system protein ImpM